VNSAIYPRDGWSNKNVGEISVATCQLSCSESSVAPIESNPEEESGTSNEISVPMSSVIVSRR